MRPSWACAPESVRDRPVDRACSSFCVDLSAAWLRSLPCLPPLALARHPCSSLSLRSKHIVELGHALAPNHFEVVEELGRALEPRAVGGDQLLAAAGTLLNETRALEHGDVLLHGGETHLVLCGQSGHRRRLRER